MPALVSVIIPTYNRARLLEQVIHSVVNQTVGNFEIVIVDDGSSDNTMGNIISIIDFFGNRSFVLVTSSGHMPRAVMLFMRVVLRPIPTPTDYYTFPDIWRAKPFPTTFHLKCSDLAVHERLGFLYYRLKGSVAPAP